MLAACQKEETGKMTTINIMAEDFHGGDSKMGAYISASRVNFTWETGDEVRINDGVFAVTRSNANATISAPEGQPFTAPIRALSPASLYDGALTSDQVQVTLPDTYQWSTFTQSIGGLNTQCQKLNAPMAFYGDASNLNYSIDRQRIVFKNLCGALAVKITNTTGLPLDMEEIQVSSNRYKLSGNLSINFTNLEGLQPVSTSTLNSVTMRFDNEDLTLDANESKVVLIPVLPVGDNNRFKITVKYRNLQYASSPSIKHCFTYDRTQPNSGNNALARSQFGYAPIDATRTTTTGNNANPKVSSSYFFQDPDGYNRIKDKYQLHFLTTLGDDEVTLYPSQAKIRIVRDIDMDVDMKPLYGVTDVDGGGHTISNAYFTTNSFGRVGLLDNPTDATIRDLTLESPKINVSALSHTQFAGFLIAKAEGTTTIDNCHVDNPNVYNAAVSGTYNNDLSIGGLIGRSNGSLNIVGSTVIKLRFSQASSSSPNYLQVNCGGMVGYATLSSSEDIQIRGGNPYWNQVVIAHENTVPLVANGEVRFGGVIGSANGGSSNWHVFVHVCVGRYNSVNDRTPFVVKSMTSDVYAGYVLGKETNSPQNNNRYLIVPRNDSPSENRYYHIYNDYINTESYLEVHKPTGNTAYTGRETTYEGTTAFYGHIVGNNNSYYNTSRSAKELKVNVVNN